jgi:hypothetical protein
LRSQQSIGAAPAPAPTLTKAHRQISNLLPNLAFALPLATNLPPHASSSPDRPKPKLFHAIRNTFSSAGLTGFFCLDEMPRLFPLLVQIQNMPQAPGFRYEKCSQKSIALAAKIKAFQDLVETTN